jgi:hypothetical protein
MRVTGSKGRGEDSAHPQSTTPKLHEIAEFPLGLLINFDEIKLTNGVHRLILPGANR